MNLSHFIPLTEYTRGPIVESMQIGAAAVVDNQARLVASLGNPDLVTYPRSSAKPFQVLSLIEDGGAEAFDLTDQEIAIMCASHSGTEKHVAVLQALQPRIGIGPEDLLCGVHPPMDKPSAKTLILRGEEPNTLHENCSGKHTGMLANAIMRGLPTEDYINPAHPVQKIIIQAAAEMMGMSPDDFILGTDGCSAPVFAMPMTNAALAFARLCDPAGLPEKRATALRRIARAMMTHPDMVSDPSALTPYSWKPFKDRSLSRAAQKAIRPWASCPV